MNKRYEIAGNKIIVPDNEYDNSRLYIELTDGQIRILRDYAQEEFVITRKKLKKYINGNFLFVEGWSHQLQKKWSTKSASILIEEFIGMQVGLCTLEETWKILPVCKEKRQSLVARLLNLLRTVEQQHADEVVEAEQFEDEDVHGADDVTQDIPDAPEREEAESTKKAEEKEGQESEEGTEENDTSDAESVPEKSGGSQDGQEGETQTSEENGREAGGSDQGTDENEESSRGIGEDNQENTSQPTLDIEAEITACFGVGVGEEVEERHDTIAGIEQGRGLSVRREIRILFEKLAFERSSYGRTDELEHWDGRKLVLAKANPNKLMRAKSGKEKDTSIYFFLDDSGSMCQHAQMFQGLLEASRHVVHVYMGSEAHPVEAVDGSYESEYIPSFYEQLKRWLDTVRPAPGSVLIFWGDTCDMNIVGDEQKVRKLLRPYRAYWLGTYKEYDYEGWEQKCLPAAGFKVIAPVSSPKELRQAVKKIK